MAVASKHVLPYCGAAQVKCTRKHVQIGFFHFHYGRIKLQLLHALPWCDTVRLGISYLNTGASHLRASVISKANACAEYSRADALFAEHPFLQDALSLIWSKGSPESLMQVELNNNRDRLALGEHIHLSVKLNYGLSCLWPHPCMAIHGLQPLRH